MSSLKDLTSIIRTLTLTHASPTQTSPTQGNIFLSLPLALPGMTGTRPATWHQKPSYLKPFSIWPFLEQRPGKGTWCLLYGRHISFNLCNNPMRWHLNSSVTDVGTKAEQPCQGRLASMSPSQAWHPGLLSSRALPTTPPRPTNLALRAAQPRPQQRRGIHDLLSSAYYPEPGSRWKGCGKRGIGFEVSREKC